MWLEHKNLLIRKATAWKDQRGEWQSSVDYELYPENFISLAI